MDDNPFLLSTDALEDDIWRVAPSIRLIGRGGMNTYSLTYDGEFGRYSDFDSEDYNDHNLTGLFEIDINQRSNLTLDAGFGQFHDDRGTGGSEGAQTPQSGVPDEFDLLSYGFQFELGGNDSTFQVRIRADVADKEYTNNRAVTFDRDKEETTYGGLIAYNLSSESAVLFEVVIGDLDYDSIPTTGFSLDSEETTYFVGFEWAIGAKTTGYIKVGQQEKNFDDPARQDQDDVSWDVAISWSPRTYSTLTLGSSKTFDETNGYGDAILSQIYDVAWRHEWNDNFVTNVRYSYTQDEHAPTSRDDETSRFDFNAVYSFRRWLDLEFNASFADRDSSAALIGYDRNIYTLSLNLGI